MKTFYFSFILWAFSSHSILAQLDIKSSKLLLDVNGDERIDVLYETSVSGPDGQFPTKVVAGSSVRVAELCRFMRASTKQVAFSRGEMVSGVNQIYAQTTQNPPPAPPSVTYDLRTIAYYGESYSPEDSASWTYTTLGEPTIFTGKTEVILGLRLLLDTGSHYGWLRFRRPVADNHTLFEVTDYAVNPIPGAPIPAGEPPPPPPVQTVVGEDGQLVFSWDSRAGELILEWAASLEASAVWQPVPDSGFPPVSLPAGEGNRFYRLRRP